MGRIITGIAALLLLSAVGAFAEGNRGGCGNCPNRSAQGQSDQECAFQRSTIDLRQELMNKRFELQRENLKAVPDKARMDGLQAEIGALQSRIFSLRTQSGLKKCANDGDCIPGGCGCGRQQAADGCGTPCGGK